jgi:hypothetical protein
MTAGTSNIVLHAVQSLGLLNMSLMCSVCKNVSIYDVFTLHVFSSVILFCILDDRIFILAVSLQNGYIFLLKSFDDVSPVQVHTGLSGPLCLEWSNSRELLAVAGTMQQTVSASNGTQQSSPDSKMASAPTVEYTNVLKFYSDTGVLLYSTIIPYTQVCY